MSWRSRRKRRSFSEKTIRLRHDLTQHHRRTRSAGGSNNPSNISWIPDNKHRAYHLLFKDMSPYQIAKELNTIYLDPQFMLVAVRRDEHS